MHAGISCAGSSSGSATDRGRTHLLVRMQPGGSPFPVRPAGLRGVWHSPLHGVAAPTHLAHPTTPLLPVGGPRRLVAARALTQLVATPAGQRAVAVLVGLPALLIGLVLGLVLLFAVADLIV